MDSRKYNLKYYKGSTLFSPEFLKIFRLYPNRNDYRDMRIVISSSLVCFHRAFTKFIARFAVGLLRYTKKKPKSAMSLREGTRPHFSGGHQRQQETDDWPLFFLEWGSLHLCQHCPWSLAVDRSSHAIL